MEVKNITPNKKKKQEILHAVVKYLNDEINKFDKDYLSELFPYPEWVDFTKNENTRKKWLSKCSFCHDEYMIFFVVYNLKLAFDKETGRIHEMGKDGYDESILDVHSIIHLISMMIELHKKTLDGIRESFYKNTYCNEIGANLKYSIDIKDIENPKFIISITIDKIDGYKIKPIILSLKKIANIRYECDVYRIHQKIFDIDSEVYQTCKDAFKKMEQNKEEYLKNMYALPAYGNFLAYSIINVIRYNKNISENNIILNLTGEISDIKTRKTPQSGQLGYFSHNDIRNTLDMLKKYNLILDDDSKYTTAEPFCQEFIELKSVVGYPKYARGFKDYTDEYWEYFLQDDDYEYGYELYYIPQIEAQQKGLDEIYREEMSVLDNKYIVRKYYNELRIVACDKPEYWHEYALTMYSISDGKDREHWKFVLNKIFYDYSTRNIPDVVNLNKSQKMKLLGYIVKSFDRIKEELNNTDYLIDMIPYPDVSAFLKNPGIYNSNLSSSEFLYQEDDNVLFFTVLGMNCLYYTDTHCILYRDRNHILDSKMEDISHWASFICCNQKILSEAYETFKSDEISKKINAKIVYQINITDKEKPLLVVHLASDYRYVNHVAAISINKNDNFLIKSSDLYDKLIDPALKKCAELYKQKKKGIKENIT